MSSFGEELRRERELRRITLREVADATKINLRYLEALDRNDFKHLPGGVFNRGFVRAYAQFIGIDPDQMVSAYLMEEQAQSADGGAETSDSLLRGTRSQPPRGVNEPSPERSGVALKVSLVVLLAAALIAGGVWGYFKLFGGKTGRPADSPQSQVTPALEKKVDPVRPAEDDVKSDPVPGHEDTGVAEQRPTPAPVPAPSDAVRATIYIDHATTGRLNCDNRQIDLLNGMPPGTQFELSCNAFLIVDAADGAALRIGWPGVAPTHPGEAGVPLEGKRIDMRTLADRAGTEVPP